MILPEVLAVLPGERDPKKVDIRFDPANGLITEIGESLDGDEKLESCRGLTVFPGFIDPHVHFRTPGNNDAEDWVYGSRSALFAGVTTVLDMPNTSPPTTTRAIYKEKKAIIEADARVNFGIYGGLTADNLDELLATPEFKGIKVYMASTTGDLLLQDISGIRDGGTDKVFFFHAEKQTIIEENLAKFGQIKTPEDHTRVRSVEAALAATNEVIALQQRTGLRCHISHVSTPQEVELLQDTELSFEVAPHHIFCSTADYAGGWGLKCNPPVREPDLVARMLALLRDEKIYMIATDHAPHPLAEKERSEPLPPSGVPSLDVGTQLILAELARGHIGYGYTAEILSRRAAKRYGIDKRGSIEVGYYADFAVVDLQKKWKMKSSDIQSKCGWSPFVGQEFPAKVVTTIVNGLAYDTADLSKGLAMQPLVFEV